MEFWERVAIAAVVVAVAAVAAKLVDARMSRKELAPEAVTRYRVLRRSVMAAIITIGVLSALLTIPAVRTIAGALLGSAAVLGVIVGFASQNTLSNFTAGLLIALTQPLRLGDRVEIGGLEGTVEEIGLTYTFVRLDDGTRLVTPNAKLAADTIRNATIVSRERLAEVTVQVPLAHELRPLVEALESETGADVFVRSLDGNATIVVRRPAASDVEAERVERDLRLRVHERLRAEGLFG